MSTKALPEFQEFLRAGQGQDLVCSGDKRGQAYTWIRTAQ